MFKQFLMLCFGLLLSSSAWGGQAIKQSVKVKEGKITTNADYQWYIDRDKFRLDVTQSGNTRNFVFNGRVFYSCGLLTPEQVSFLMAKKEDQALFKKLEGGSCQQVSTDFYVRFLMSPYEAIYNNIVSDGIVSNIVVSNNKVNLSGSMGKIKGTKCVNFRRLYNIAENNTGAKFKFFEKSCHAPSLKWRKKLDRELAKILMRQTSGRKFSKELRNDVKKMGGFTLLSRFVSKGIDANSKEILQRFDIKTKNISKKFDKKLVGIPKGFKIVDNQVIALLDDVKVGSSATATNTKEPTLGGVLSFFLGGGQPAAVLIKAGNSNEKEVGH